MKFISAENKSILKDFFSFDPGHFSNNTCFRTSSNTNLSRVINVSRDFAVAAFLLATPIFVATNNFYQEAGMAKSVLAGVMTGAASAFHCLGESILMASILAPAAACLGTKFKQSKHEILSKVSKVFTLNNGFVAGITLGSLVGATSGYDIGSDIVKYGLSTHTNAATESPKPAPEQVPSGQKRLESSQPSNDIDIFRTSPAMTPFFREPSRSKITLSSVPALCTYTK